MRPIIDDTFKAWLPDQTPEALAALRDDITAYGVEDRLIVWKETGILLDGHTRLLLAEELGLPYRVREKSFATREDALDFVTLHQRARRNLTEAQAWALRGRKHDREVRKHGTNQHTRNHLGDGSSSKDTAQRLADEYGVCPAVIERDARYARELDVIALVDPAVTKDILAGKLSGKRPHVTAAAKAAAAGLDPREAIVSVQESARARMKEAAKNRKRQTAEPDAPPRPTRGARDMAGGVLKTLDSVSFIDTDMHATMLWPHWSAEETQQVNDKIDEVVNLLRQYKKRLAASKKES